jgi:F-type H+-transporting ATPase subunit b
MQFDLFTFLASLFNFLVLLALLRIFLFKRVTQAMDAREDRIAANWDEAEQEKHKAQELKSEYEQKMQQAGKERDDILQEAHAEMEREKRERMEEIRDEIDAKRTEWLHALESDKERLLRAVREQVARATVESTRSALQALAGTTLERQMVERLLEAVAEQNGEIAQSLEGAEVEVTTSSSLSEDDRERIRSRLRDVGAPASVEFTESSDLICGVRLQVGDREIGWSVSDHVAELESSIDELIQAR